MLNEFEKSLIPYKSYQEFNFIDEEGNTFIATSQPQENIVKVRHINPHGCDQEEVETITSALNFDSKDLVIDIILEANFIANMTLQRDSNRLSPFILTCDFDYNKQIQEHLQNITIHGFEFQNVLIFEHCSKNSQINRIIYSTTNGIEFIEFNYGKWFKLNT